MSLSGKSSSTDSTSPSCRSSAEQSSEILVAKHLRSGEYQTCRLSQICDFSIGCMHVIGRIINLYQSGISPSDGLTPIGLSVLTNQTVHVMQEMERISHSSRETHIQMLHSSLDLRRLMTSLYMTSSLLVRHPPTQARLAVP
ncbi:hypothetical protein AOLI_G00241790 [Acnodon oligacanthus]